MEAPVLRVVRRTHSGKGVARKIRAQGLIPAVLYGGGENTIFQLNVEGETTEDRKALVRELQWDPLKETLLHADLYRISMDVEITVSVPLVLQGMSREVSDV